MSLGLTNRIWGLLMGKNLCQLCDQIIRLRKVVITRILVGIKYANISSGG